jgi:hypothetical protein
MSYERRQLARAGSPPWGGDKQDCETPQTADVATSGLGGGCAARDLRARKAPLVSAAVTARALCAGSGRRAGGPGASGDGHVGQRGWRSWLTTTPLRRAAQSPQLNRAPEWRCSQRCTTDRIHAHLPPKREPRGKGWRAGEGARTVALLRGASPPCRAPEQTRRWDGRARGSLRRTAETAGSPVARRAHGAPAWTWAAAGRAGSLERSQGKTIASAGVRSTFPALAIERKRDFVKAARAAVHMQ